MRGDDAPALGQPYPGLRLEAAQRGVAAHELDLGHRQVGPEGVDAQVLQPAGELGRRGARALADPRQLAAQVGGGRRIEFAEGVADDPGAVAVVVGAAVTTKVEAVEVLVVKASALVGMKFAV